MDYDKRLDSPDVVQRQQAEIEALRTALVASNSDSNGECERLRAEIEALKASHAGQLRNTLAFKAERDAFLEALKHTRKKLAHDHECPGGEDCHLSCGVTQAWEYLDAAIAKATT